MNNKSKQLINNIGHSVTFGKTENGMGAVGKTPKMIEKLTVTNKPRYASLAEYDGKQVVVMGNTVQDHLDGTKWVWASDWVTGVRINAHLDNFKYCNQEQPSLLDVVHRVEDWAHDGDDDAMWWLGDFYESGSRDIGCNGGKALAYYLGAIHRKPNCYDKATVERVLLDGQNLFSAAHPKEIEDEAPADTNRFLANFREYRDYTESGYIYLPDQWDWKSCIDVAESV